MDKLEKVELVREKCGVSYQDAKEALEACDYDVLDAIIWLERAGKVEAQTASYETSGATSATQTASLEMREAQEEYHRTSKKTKFGEMWGSFCRQLKSLLRAGIDMVLAPALTNYIDIVEAAVLSGALPESRIDDACSRVLDMKEKYVDEDDEADDELFDVKLEDEDA
jgi:hypothetical protein